MKLLSLLLFKWDADHCTLVSKLLNLNDFNFFQRKTIQEYIIFHSRLICSRTAPGTRISVAFSENLGNCYVMVTNEKFAVCCLTSSDYPMRSAFSLLSEASRSFLSQNGEKWREMENDCELPFLEGATLFEKYQDPIANDKILKVQRDLDEVRDVMLKNIDDLLKRGETLDCLMQKSSDLSATSYQFYRTAKKNNQCCQLY